MGKGGGEQHTPYEQPDNLKSKQKVSIIDAIGEGPIEGPVNGLQSVLLKMTPAIDSNGDSNVNGMSLQWVAGENEQPALKGFEGAGTEVPVNAEIKNGAPLTRTITSTNIDRLRFTFGVQSLVQAQDNGDRVGTSVDLQIQIMRGGRWVTERRVTISGKTTTQYLNALVVDNLPPRPFDIRMVRSTPNSNSDMLQNKTLWTSYTEIIDVQQQYPNTAVVGLTFDSEQYGSEIPSRNYHIRGRIVQIPSNYDPLARTYSGIWDGSFKPGWTDNPAWCLYDVLTHPRYGLGKKIGSVIVDKWALYTIGQYADALVPNGYGGKEPRMRCNGYITTRRSAYEVISDFCSIMRCMPVWNGQLLTFIQDRPADCVWPYTNANVVDGKFSYTFSPKSSRHNAVLVRWVNPDNGWKEDFEYVSDDLSIAANGLNQLEIDAFCCTSRGQAYRHGLWILTTEKLEVQTVSFKVGADGLKHLPGDVIEVADNDYAANQIGGRLLNIDEAGRSITLDRSVTLPAGKVTVSVIGTDGRPLRLEVESQLAPDVLVLKSLPSGIKTLGVWSLSLPSLRQRLYRCVSIKDNRDGTYSIVAIQHVPEKENVVDNGASFDPKPGSGSSSIPPAVEHLDVEITPDDGQYQAIARWDTPRVVSGVRFELKLNRADRVVGSQVTSDMEYRLSSLPQGAYTLSVRAINQFGQKGDPSSVNFNISVPDAPAFIELTPGYFQITITPRLSYYRQDVQYEFWFSEKRITDYRLIESTALKLGISSYWVKDRLMKLGTDYYFYVRSVNQVGKSNFVEAVGQVSNDANGYLDFFKGKITESYLGKELLEKVDLTTDNASRLTQFEKEWKDTNNKWNAMWGVKIEQTEDGKHYVAGLGLSMEDTPEGKLSQFIVAANRIAFIDPTNGNTTPMFVGQGDQIWMNDVFLKRLYAASITSSGNPPTFSLTPEGHLTAKSADISGNVNATSGKFSNVVIDSTCDIKYLRAESIDGDIVKNMVINVGGTLNIEPARFARKMVIPTCFAETIAWNYQTGGSNPQDKHAYVTANAILYVNGQRYVVAVGGSSLLGEGSFIGIGSFIYSIPAGASVAMSFRNEVTGNSGTRSPSVSPFLLVNLFKE
ncbi:TipJ family phage tail tip protein [Edwardsiella tarda]